MRTTTLFVLAASLGTSGCTSLALEDSTARYLERAYQFTHAMDSLQTRAIARDPDCYWEDFPVTRELIGKRPSEAEVYAYAVTYAYGHAWISKKLERWPRWQRIWQIGSFGLSIRNVIHNHNVGLRVDADNVPCGT